MEMFWLVLLAVLIVVEMITLGLTTIWFAGGALVAFVFAIFGASIWIQIIAFLISSILFLLSIRPLAMRCFNRQRVKTNVESLIGREAKVLEVIDNFNASGCVSINGQEWTARSESDQVFEVGKKVIVKEISGVKVIVTDKISEN